MRTLRILAFCLVIFCSCSPTVEKAKVASPVYFKADPVTAARISGTVRFAGKFPKPRPIDMDQDEDCSKLYAGKAKLDESMLVDRQGGLGNAFVYIKAGLESKLFVTPTTAVTIDQKGCWFEPRVMGIQTGQPFHVTNSDPVTHNIHPVAHENRGWNQSMAPESPQLTRSFALPEVMVPVKCNIHNWMRAWVGVLNHPYFAVSGADGNFTIPNVPPGTYTLSVWHEKLGTQEQELTLGASGQATVAFTFKGN